MLNLDFSRPVTIPASDETWQPGSPVGITRKRLAFDEQELGHATSLVRIDPGVSVPEHKHAGGEEVLVLDGILSDEHGDYGGGTYIRYPTGSVHAPFTQSGCTLFVKLNQFADGDVAQIVVNTESATWQPGKGGLKVMPLHSFGGESTSLVKWPAGEKYTSHQHVGGEEILVLEGELIDEHGRYPAGTWMRSPHQSTHQPYVEQETIIFVKTGHL